MIHVTRFKVFLQFSINKLHSYRSVNSKTLYQCSVILIVEVFELLEDSLKFEINVRISSVNTGDASTLEHLVTLGW